MITTKITYKTDLDLPAGVERWLYSIVKNCIGAEKAVGRDRINELLSKYHGIELDDRALRRVVEKIRNRGVRLADLEKGGGLFICKTDEEFRAFKIRYASHAWTLIKTMRAMEKGVPVEDLTDDIDVLEQEPEPVQMELI